MRTYATPLDAAKARRAWLMRLLESADHRQAMTLQRKLEGVAAEIKSLSASHSGVNL